MSASATTDTSERPCTRLGCAGKMYVVAQVYCTSMVALQLRCLRCARVDYESVYPAEESK